MSPSPEHEELNEAVKKIVDVACEELGIEVRPLGSATHRRLALEKGVEPDSAFYFGDVTRDPTHTAPDLAVEIEISRSALDKLPIFARLGVPEVWRCGAQSVQIFKLAQGQYEAAERSGFLPLDASGLTLQLQARWTRPRSQWVTGLRAWIRDAPP